MENIRNKKGITLITLVMTIIVLLILSGITISAITGNNIFEKTISAKEKAKISQYESEINKAKTQVVMNQYYPTTTPRNILEKIKEILQGNELFESSNYNIETYNGTEIMTIKTAEKYVFEIIVDLTNNIEISYISTEEKVPPTINIKNVTNTTNSITVNVITRNNSGGDIEFYIAKENENYRAAHGTIENVQNLNEYTYTFGQLQQGETYKIKAIAKATNNKKSQTEKTNITTGQVVEIKTGDITFNFQPAGWTNGNVTVTANANIDITGFVLQTSKDGINYTNNASQTFTENGTIYARVVDSTEQYRGIATRDIESIDKTKPTDITIATENTTTSSISISVSANDIPGTNEYASGISQYRFSKDNGSTWSDYQTNNSYTFSNLVSGFGTSYNIKVEVKDLAGNTEQGSRSISTRIDTDYYVNTEGELLAYIGGRTFNKTNNLPAITNVILSSGGNYYHTLIVSPEIDAVKYYTNHDNLTVSSSGSVNYNGTTYYYSSTGRGMPFGLNINSKFMYLHESATAYYEFIDAVNALLNKYFYGTETDKKYIISYDANGGTGAPGKQIKTKNQSLSLSATQPTKEGYHFLGWSTNKNATTATYQAGGTYTENKCETLYAIWQKHNFSDNKGICTVCGSDERYLSYTSGGENWNSSCISTFASGFKVGDYSGICSKIGSNGWTLSASCTANYATDRNHDLGGNICMIIYKTPIDVTNLDKIVMNCWLYSNHANATNYTTIGLSSSNSASEYNDYYAFNTSQQISNYGNTLNKYNTELNVRNLSGTYYLKVTTRNEIPNSLHNTSSASIDNIYRVFK